MKKTTLLLVSVIIALSLQVQSQTLIAHWPLQGNANDVTVNERHLTTAGSDWNWVTDVGRGEVFESTATGVKLSIPVPDESPLNVRSNFTITFWVKNSGDPYVWNNAGTRLFAKNLQFQINGGTNNNEITEGRGDYANTRMRSGGSNYNFEPWSPPVSFSDGNWHHLALTCTNGYLATLYVDGNPISSSQLPGLADINGTQIEIGTAYGRFSDVRMYNSALSTVEINTIMSDVTGGVGELSSENLAIYPNPATSFVTISLGSGIQRVYISDLSARIVYFNSSVNSNELNISTSKFETGVYLIRIFSNDSVITRKLQIVK